MVPMSNQNQSEKAAVKFQEQAATVKTHKNVIGPSPRTSDHRQDPQGGHQATVKNEFGNIKTHRKVSFSTARFLNSIDCPGALRNILTCAGYKDDKNEFLHLNPNV